MAEAGLDDPAEEGELAALAEVGLEARGLGVALGQGVDRRLDQLVGLVVLAALLGDPAQLEENLGGADLGEGAVVRPTEVDEQRPVGPLGAGELTALTGELGEGAEDRDVAGIHARGCLELIDRRGDLTVGVEHLGEEEVDLSPLGGAAPAEALDHLAEQVLGLGEVAAAEEPLGQHHPQAAVVLGDRQRPLEHRHRQLGRADLHLVERRRLAGVGEDGRRVCDVLGGDRQGVGCGHRVVVAAEEAEQELAHLGVARSLAEGGLQGLDRLVLSAGGDLCPAELEQDRDPLVRGGAVEATVEPAGGLTSLVALEVEAGEGVDRDCARDQVDDRSVGADRPRLLVERIFGELGDPHPQVGGVVGLAEVRELTGLILEDLAELAEAAALAEDRRQDLEGLLVPRLLGEVGPEGADPRVTGLELAGEAGDLEAELEATGGVLGVAELAVAELQELGGPALLRAEICEAEDVGEGLVALAEDPEVEVDRARALVDPGEQLRGLTPEVPRLDRAHRQGRAVEEEARRELRGGAAADLVERPEGGVGGLDHPRRRLVARPHPGGLAVETVEGVADELVVVAGEGHRRRLAERVEVGDREGVDPQEVVDPLDGRPGPQAMGEVAEHLEIVGVALGGLLGRGDRRIVLTAAFVPARDRQLELAGALWGEALAELVGGGLHRVGERLPGVVVLGRLGDLIEERRVVALMPAKGLNSAIRRDLPLPGAGRVAGGRLLIDEVLWGELGRGREGRCGVGDVFQVLGDREPAGVPELRCPCGRLGGPGRGGGEGLGELLPGVGRLGEPSQIMLEGDVAWIGDQRPREHRPRADRIVAAVLEDPRGLGEEAGAGVVVAGEGEAGLDQLEHAGPIVDPLIGGEQRPHGDLRAGLDGDDLAQAGLRLLALGVEAEGGGVEAGGGLGVVEVAVVELGGADVEPAGVARAGRGGALEEARQLAESGACGELAVEGAEHLGVITEALADAEEDVDRLVDVAEAEGLELSGAEEIGALLELDHRRGGAAEEGRDELFPAAEELVEADHRAHRLDVVGVGVQTVGPDPEGPLALVELLRQVGGLAEDRLPDRRRLLEIGEALQHLQPL